MDTPPGSVDNPTTYVTRPGYVAGPQTQVGENVMTVRDRIQWGPIFGGVISAVAAFLLLTILGLALGASVLGPQNEGGEIGTWAAIWGAFSAIAAFFIGGWIAARTASVDGSFAGLMNGLLVGATGLLFLIWLSASGLGNLFGLVGSGVGTVVNAVSTAAPAAQQATGTSGSEAGNAIEDATGINTDDPAAAATQVAGAAQAAVDEAGAAVEQAANDPATFEAVRNGALGTFLALLLPIVAATLGGFTGKHTRDELIHGSGA